MNNFFNKYDILLVTACILLAAGNIGGFFQPIRILLFILIPFIVFDRIRYSSSTLINTRPQPSYKYERILFFIWWVYAFISLAFAINFESSIKEFIHLTIYFVGFFEIIWLASKARHPQHAILLGWLLMFMCTLPIAINEITTDHHLSLSVQEEGETLKLGGIKEERRFASVTFGNLNSYNTILCYILAFLLIRTQFLTTKLSSIINYACTIGVSILVIINSSRGALLCMGVTLLIFLFSIMKTKRKNIVFILIGLCLVVYIITTQFSNIFSFVFMRFQSQGLEDEGRSAIIFSSLLELMNSIGLGIGVGNFAPTMANKYNLDVAAPHNLWLEIGVQFGIIILLGFIGMLIRIWNMAHNGHYINRFAAIIGLFALIFSSYINSLYLLNASLWMYIVSLYILCNPQYNITYEKS